MNIQKLQAVVEEMDRRIRREVSAGFLGDEEVLEHAIEEQAEEFSEKTLRPVAERLLRDEAAKHRLEAMTWPPLTDCDRLDSAFAELEARGILCRQDYNCCGVCAASAIIEEIDEELACGAPIRGFVYYHGLDTDSAKLGRGLHMTFGSSSEGDAAALAIGREIVEELRRQGLPVRWDGRWTQRIFVDVDWKRRRPSPWLSSMGYRVSAPLLPALPAQVSSLSG